MLKTVIKMFKMELRNFSTTNFQVLKKVHALFGVYIYGIET